MLSEFGFWPQLLNLCVCVCEIESRMCAMVNGIMKLC